MPVKATLILIPVVTLTPPTPTPTRSLFVIAPLSPPSHVSRHAPRTSPSLVHARDRESNGRVLALSRPDDDDNSYSDAPRSEERMGLPALRSVTTMLCSTSALRRHTFISLCCVLLAVRQIRTRPTRSAHVQHIGLGINIP